jgi:hypothetical protein
MENPFLSAFYLLPSTFSFLLLAGDSVLDSLEPAFGQEIHCRRGRN